MFKFSPKKNLDHLLQNFKLISKIPFSCMCFPKNDKISYNSLAFNQEFFLSFWSLFERFWSHARLNRILFMFYCCTKIVQHFIWLQRWNLAWHLSTHANLTLAIFSRLLLHQIHFTKHAKFCKIFWRVIEIHIWRALLVWKNNIFLDIPFKSFWTF